MLCDILYISCFIDIFPWLKQWLGDYMRHDMFIHVYFSLKVVVKRKRWLRSLVLRAAVWTEAFIQLSVAPHQRVPKLYLLFEFPEKKFDNLKDETLFPIKVTVYKTGSYQWSSTHAVVKTKVYLFGRHGYRTKSPVPLFFGTNTCTIAPL